MKIEKLTRIAAASLLVVAAGASGACSKKQSTSSTTETSTAPAPVPTPTPAPAPAPAGVTLSEVRLGNAIGTDKSVATPMEAFSPRDTIYASVTTTGSAAATPMRALWTYQDGQVVSDDNQTVVPTGADTTEFHISKPDGFPAGSYKVEIFIAGNSVATRSFTVR
jgi:hypothetical protein